ncbi:MAG: gliding motility lipoprotein GldH [Tannerella sp.]|jgi:gliding motility-associated lipoprotein GldH|nr:gliding motility lipoprotein GldH [Tannerella sp.]
MGILRKDKQYLNGGNTLFILLLSLSIALFSCIKPPFYEGYQVVDDQWNKNKEVYFIFEIADTTASYDISLNIRNNNLYPYQNLWLFCAQEQPDGTALRDTIECTLADDFGKWLGSGISLHHINLPIREQYKFPMHGTFTISIRQGMRDDAIVGIEQIGLRIEKKL